MQVQSYRYMNIYKFQIVVQQYLSPIVWSFLSRQLPTWMHSLYLQYTAPTSSSRCLLQRQSYAHYQGINNVLTSSLAFAWVGGLYQIVSNSLSMSYNR